MSLPIAAPRRVFRDSGDRFLAGVASGVARHLGVRTSIVRVAFLVMVLWSGFGVLLYAALWALVPLDDPTLGDEQAAPGLVAASRRGFRDSPASRLIRRRDLGLAVSIGAIALGGIVLLQVLGLWISPQLFWPLLVAAAGLALVWRQADESDRQEWLSTSGGWKAWLRVVVGAVLLVAALGFGVFQAGLSGSAGLGEIVGAIALAVLGLGLVLGPWALRLNRELRRERTERIRSQERADVAAHLHDSVLQTLALIQRQSDDPAVVSQLARTQERELRSWLFDPPAGAAVTVKAALQQAIGEVEIAHQVPIELVAVGDCPVDARTSALVAAAREAMVNASRHSGAPRIDVFAEVTDRQLEVFVRDRGHGFDVDSVPDDRHGVRRSIIDRVTRHGGEADVRSNPASGTEVQLVMPLTPSPTSQGG
ncbi:MAG: PspC domain-containing protein [Nocardioidaceae bacterium]